MPTRDRKFYIAKHNGVEEKKNKPNGESKIDGLFIDKFTDMSQLKGAR